MKSSARRFSAVFLASLLLSGLAAQAEESVSLAGKWRFSRDDAKKGVAAKWYAGDLKPSGDEPAEIALPGTTDEAKAGHPTKEKPNYMGLFRPNVYTGPAWYQREVEIPADWQGKHVTLFLERNHWTNHVWLDDKDCGTQDSLIAPQVYDLGTDVAPGKHRLTVCVDNTIKYDLGGFASIYTEYTQTNWNGLIGAIELRAADPVAVTDLQVYPDLDKKMVKVVAKIGNATGASASGQLQLSVAGADGTAQGTPATAAYSSGDAETTVTAEVPMGDNFKTWDEFSPNLYTLKAALTAGANHSEKSASFGMRVLSRQGTQFALNGRPLILRGTLEDAVFPLTGYPPTDVAAWRRIYQIEKSYGLNFIRFHSWCPPEAAFAAADLEGVYIQAEGPNADIAFGTVEGRDKFLEQEFLRMVNTYGNHPSFLLMPLGNEDGGTKEAGLKLLTHWIDLLISTDSRHLYTSPTMGKNTPNQQWTETQDGRGVRGANTMDDLRTVVAKFPHPIVGHEIGQWAAYPNLEEAKKYTGVVNAANFELVRADLAKKGMLDLAPQFTQSTGHLAAILYKEEVEVLLRTPGLGGFSLLDLHDYPGQGMALVGMLDPFWDSKGFVTPEEFKSHTGPVTPLLRIPKRIYIPGDTFSAKAEVAQFGPADLPDAHATWTIKDEAGEEIAAGIFPPAALPTGKLSELGTLTAPLAKAHVPCKATITIAIDGTPYANHWDIWIYPPPGAVKPPSDVVAVTDWDDAKKALADGKKVAFFPVKLDPKTSRKGAFYTIFWSPVWFHLDPSTMGILCDPKHPLFAQFPTEFYNNWQWWDLLLGSRSMILNDLPQTFRPLVRVVDNFTRNDRLANVFEATVGNGSLFVCSLPVYGAKTPEAAQFLRSAYAYLGSADFQPKQSLDLDALDKYFTIIPPHLQKLAVKVYKTDSEQPGLPGSNVLDGDPMTFWHTSWSQPVPQLPHYIILDLGKEMTVKALNYLPRQDSGTGRIKMYHIYVGNDPANLGEPVFSGEFLNNESLQSAVFPQPASGRYVKLEALSSVTGEPYIAIGELDLDVDAP